MQNKRVSLQIDIVFSVQQSTNIQRVLLHRLIPNAEAETWFEVLQRAAKLKRSERAETLRFTAQTVASKPGKVPFYYTSAKTFPSNFCV